MSGTLHVKDGVLIYTPTGGEPVHIGHNRVQTRWDRWVRVPMMNARERLAKVIAPWLIREDA